METLERVEVQGKQITNLPEGGNMEGMQSIQASLTGPMGRMPLGTTSPRYAQRDESKQAIRGGNDIFMKEKNGKVPWKEAIKRYVVAIEGTLNRRDPRKKKRAVFSRSYAAMTTSKPKT